MGREPWVLARGDCPCPLEPGSGRGAGARLTAFPARSWHVPVGATLTSTVLRAQNSPRWKRRFSCHDCRLTEDSPRDARLPSAALGAQGCPRSAVLPRVYAGQGGGSPPSGRQLLPQLDTGFAGQGGRRPRAGPGGISWVFLVWTGGRRLRRGHALGGRLGGAAAGLCSCPRVRGTPVCEACLVSLQPLSQLASRETEGFEMAVKFIVICWRPHSLYCATYFGNC